MRFNMLSQTPCPERGPWLDRPFLNDLPEYFPDGYVDGGMRMTPRAFMIARWRVSEWELKGSFTIDYGDQFLEVPVEARFSNGSEEFFPNTERELRDNDWFTYFQDETQTISFFADFWWHRDDRGANHWSRPEVTTQFFHTIGGLANPFGVASGQSISAAATPKWQSGQPGQDFYADLIFNASAGNPPDSFDFIARNNASIRSDVQMRPILWWQWARSDGAESRFNPDTGARQPILSA